MNDTERTNSEHLKELAGFYASLAGLFGLAYGIALVIQAVIT